MAKVLGVGGIFFKSPDPAKLYAWYDKWLGIKAMEGAGAIFKPADMPTAGRTVWSAFDAGTDYFGPSGQEFMFNLVVDNVEEALKQVREGGAEVVGGPEDYDDFGRFGWFVDPDGHKVELWEPAKK